MVSPDQPNQFLAHSIKGRIHQMRPFMLWANIKLSFVILHGFRQQAFQIGDATGIGGVIR